MGNLIISPQKASLPQISLIFYMGSFPISDLCVLGFLFFQVRYTDLWLVLVRWEAKLPKLQSKTRRRSPVVAPTSACNTIADSSQPVYIYIYIYLYISLNLSFLCVLFAFSIWVLWQHGFSTSFWNGFWWICDFDWCHCFLVCFFVVVGFGKKRGPNSSEKWSGWVF